MILNETREGQIAVGVRLVRFRHDGASGADGAVEERVGVDATDQRPAAQARRLQIARLDQSIHRRLRNAQIPGGLDNSQGRARYGRSRNFDVGRVHL